MKKKPTEDMSAAIQEDLRRHESLPRDPVAENEKIDRDIEISHLVERIESLEKRLDLLYRWTVGDRTGYRYPVPNFALGRGDTHPGVFPEPDYTVQGGPRKPQGEP